MDYIDLITFSLYITTFISPMRKLANFAEHVLPTAWRAFNRFVELMAHGARPSRTHPTPRT